MSNSSVVAVALAIVGVVVVVYLFISLFLSIYLSIYLPSIYQSLCKFENEAILRDFLNFGTWQNQKRSNSARHPSKLESWVQSWWPCANFQCALQVFHCMSLTLPRKSDARSYEVPHVSRKIISANLKIWCSKMQTFSGNQSPGLLTSLMMLDQKAYT